MEKALNSEREEENSETASLLQAISEDYADKTNQIRLLLSMSCQELEGTDGETNRKELRRSLKDICILEEQIERIVGNLLSVTACKEGTRVPQLELVDLGKLFSELVRQTKPIQRERNLTIEWKPTRQSILLRTDRDYLEIILVSLLSNAVRACDVGGHIRMGARAEKEGVSLWVEDDGCGLSPEDGSQRRHFLGGTQTGLAVCRVYCRRMGWHLELSPAEKKGTKAVLFLPSEFPLDSIESEIRFSSPQEEDAQRSGRLSYRLNREMHSILGLEEIELDY